MKAQYVYENVRFERGKDPKSSMDVGLRSNAIRIKDLLRWSSKFQDVVPMADSQAMTFLEWPERGTRMYATSVILDETDPESGEYRLDSIIRSKRPIIYRNKIFIPDNEFGGHYTPHDLNESIRFERGQNPKEAMKIGQSAKIRELIEKEVYDARLINLNNYERWDYEYVNFGGYDSYIVHIKDSHMKKNPYVGVIPGLWVTSYEESPKLILDEFEIYVKRNDII